MRTNRYHHAPSPTACLSHALALTSEAWVGVGGMCRLPRHLAIAPRPRIAVPPADTTRPRGPIGTGPAVLIVTRQAWRLYQGVGLAVLLGEEPGL
jgi:hypothetical protein